MTRIFISFVFGCLAAMAALMIFLCAGVVRFLFFTGQSGTIGWDPVSVRWFYWLLLLPFFASGFWLTYWRKREPGSAQPFGPQPRRGDRE